MAPYHIRQYEENDRKRVIDLFSMAKAEHIPATFRHILKLPQTIVLLLGGPLAVILVSGSWVLAFLASLALLAALRFLAKYPWKQFVVMSLHTDMSDITKSYLSEHGSGFWVAESKGQVVGMVGALPVKQPTLQKEQLELLHLCVAPEHRGQGIAKALVRTVLTFARDQGYGEVVLTTSMLQHSALALYQRLGFQKTSQFFSLKRWRLISFSQIQFTYCLPSAQVSQALEQGGGLWSAF